MVLVTQGTIERATEKRIVPALDALKDTDVLVIVTTSGNNTAELRQRFPQKNLIIDYSTPFSGRDA
ncbi:MAG: hypothetical protein ABWY16_07800 [Pedobacter sp.]|uniref:hypothetical protein n=1 Tax=Pedobacter sp. TaxID=1411316 RepID=UPI00339864C6